MNGSVDSKNFKGSGSAKVPLTLATLSGTGPVVGMVPATGGTLGVVATGGYTAVLAGQTQKAKNSPLGVAVSGSNQANCDTNWSLSLTLTKKYTLKLVPYIAADAAVTLPDKVTTTFAERKVKYNVKTGYRVALANGKTPDNKVDKHTSLVIFGMTLTGTGSNWTPTAGTVKYKFLGQSGSASLTQDARLVTPHQ